MTARPRFRMIAFLLAASAFLAASPAGAAVLRLRPGFQQILDLPDVKERMQNISYIAAPSTPEEYNKILRGQFEALTKVVRDGGLRPK